MFTIKRNGELVKVLRKVELQNWDCEWVPEVLVFKTEKSAREVASIWEDGEVCLEDETIDITSENYEKEV